MKSRRDIALVYLGDFFFDARLINMTLSLLKENYQVSIIGTHTKIFHVTLFKDVQFYQIQLIKRGRFKYLEFHNKAKKILRNNQYDLILSCDLYSLSAVVACKKSTQQIIYDCREIYFKLNKNVVSSLKQKFFYGKKFN